MKHLAQIHAEFVKYAADHLGWWEDMSNAEQKDYIKRHPKTRMRQTPERGTPEVGKYTRGDQREVDLKKSIAHKVLRQLRRHPGDARVDPRVDEKGNLQYDVNSGHEGWTPNNLIYKKDGKLFENNRFRGDYGQDPEIKPDEAASIIRHHMGHQDMDHMDRKKKESKPKKIRSGDPIIGDVVDKRHEQTDENPSGYSDHRSPEDEVPEEVNNWEGAEEYNHGDPEPDEDKSNGTSPVDRANEESKKLHGGKEPWWNAWDSSD